MLREFILDTFQPIAESRRRCAPFELSTSRLEPAHFYASGFANFVQLLNEGHHVERECVCNFCVLMVHPAVRVDPQECVRVFAKSRQM